MIDRGHDLPITKQAKVLHISRSSVYYLPRPVSMSDLEIMRRLDRLHLEFPFAGSRMLRGLLSGEGCKIGRRHVKTLMKRMGIEAPNRRGHASFQRCIFRYIRAFFFDWTGSVEYWRFENAMLFFL